MDQWSLFVAIVRPLVQYLNNLSVNERSLRSTRAQNGRQKKGSGTSQESRAYKLEKERRHAKRLRHAEQLEVGRRNKVSIQSIVFPGEIVLVLAPAEAPTEQVGRVGCRHGRSADGPHFGGIETLICQESSSTKDAPFILRSVARAPRRLPRPHCMQPAEWVHVPCDSAS
ncbi:hypothetical protein VTI74DRAFT_1449 [Chaetomium olivicolor]